MSHSRNTIKRIETADADGLTMHWVQNMFAAI